MLFHPRLAQGPGDLLLTAQIEPRPDAPEFLLFQAADAASAWEERARYPGRVAAVLGRVRPVLFVFQDGKVAVQEEDELVFKGQRNLRLDIACAAVIQGLPHAIDASQPRRLRLLAIHGTEWEAVGPALPIVGRAQQVALVAQGGAPVIFWRSEIGDRPEPGLRASRLSGETWTSLPACPHPQRGFYAAAVRGSTIVLVRESTDPEVHDRLLLSRFNGTTWTEAPGGLPLPPALHGQRGRGLGLLATDDGLLLARADRSGLHILKADPAGRDWRLSATPFAISTSGPWLSFLLLAVLLVGLTLFMLKQHLARRAGHRASGRRAPVGLLASPLDRALALIIDGMLLAPLPLLLLFTGGTYKVLGLWKTEWRTLYWAWLAGAILYTTVAEARWGRTVGKSLLGLRVRSAGGGRPSGHQVLLRNLLRIVDFWPVAFGRFELPYLVALVCVALTPRRQRLGDLLARTLVVKHTPLQERSLLLASASPRRRELLEGLGLPFRTAPADVDESVRPAESPEEAALRLARTKATAVARNCTQSEVVIGADTLVVHDGDAIGKPRDRDDARAILRRLSGSTHRVVTGLAIIDRGTGQQLGACEQTEIDMKPMTDEEIEAYVASGESDGKAGAYAIQESGDRFVTAVRGSLSNVIGLPVELLRQMFDELDA